MSRQRLFVNRPQGLCFPAGEDCLEANDECLVLAVSLSGCSPALEPQT
jgi:hypothetical protein